MKYILKNDYSKRIVWYDEGMTQLLSGEKQKYDNQELFKNYYKQVKESTKIIPNLNELTHGITFKNEQYNAYDLSYLAIKYLSETLDNQAFIDLMSDFHQIKKIGNTIIYDMFNYYDNKISFRYVS